MNTVMPEVIKFCSHKTSVWTFRRSSCAGVFHKLADTSRIKTGLTVKK